MNRSDDAGGWVEGGCRLDGWGMSTRLTAGRGVGCMLMVRRWRHVRMRRVRMRFRSWLFGGTLVDVVERRMGWRWEGGWGGACGIQGLCCLGPVGGGVSFPQRGVGAHLCKRLPERGARTWAASSASSSSAAAPPAAASPVRVGRMASSPAVGAWSEVAIVWGLSPTVAKSWGVRVASGGGLEKSGSLC